MKIKPLLYIILALCCSPVSHAIIPVGGWGYSLGYAADRALGVISKKDKLWYWWIDPAADKIFDGRFTLKYNSSLFTVEETGWVGDFGLDPTLPAPPASIDGVSPTLNPSSEPWALQGANGALVGSSVIVNPTAGLITVSFDWGTTGYSPADESHRNIFGIAVSLPDWVGGFEFVQAGTGDVGLLGSAADVNANGVNALTYLRCEGGYCGEPPIGDLRAVPEPSTIALWSTLGLAGGAYLRFRRRKNSEERR